VYTLGPSLPHLKALDLSGNAIKNAGSLAALTPCLTSLKLGGNPSQLDVTAVLHISNFACRSNSRSSSGVLNDELGPDGGSAGDADGDNASRSSSGSPDDDWGLDGAATSDADEDYFSSSASADSTSSGTPSVSFSCASGSTDSGTSSSSQRPPLQWLFPQLQVLDISGLTLNGFEVLSAHTMLTRLDLQGVHMRSSDSISVLSQLQHLSIPAQQFNIPSL
jgi:hypothetical protein